MSHNRHWQAEVMVGEGRMIFGVRASSLPAALLKAYQRVDGLPATHLMLTRVYWKGMRRRR